jgi:3-deoxy-D-arabino-heptulosonate 7-phosphate (DAHP) synthase
MMMQIDVRANGINELFMTNGNGTCFFVLRDGAAKQIDCFSGYNSLRRMKKAIREYLAQQHETLPRLSYKPVGNDDRWIK